MVDLLEKKMTWREFRELDFPDDDPYTYELINGEIVKKAAPSPQHQAISRRLTNALEQYLTANPVGEFFYAPVDVFFDDYTRTQPDLLFIQAERTFLIDPVEGIFGAPDLVMEIISPGTGRLDRYTKRALHERFGVREYWLIDPGNRTVEIFVMRDNACQLPNMTEIEGKAVSTILPGFEVDLVALFRPLPSRA